MKKERLMPLLLVVLAASSCTEQKLPSEDRPERKREAMSLSEVARMMSELPIAEAQLREVHDAVSSSTGNGYDEEYMMSDILGSPGSGVGDRAETRAVKASRYETPLRDLITDYLSGKTSVKSGGADVEKTLNLLSDSDIQIYWPYSGDWDGETFPIVTYDPSYGAQTNYGYEIRPDASGYRVVDSVLVDENLAKTRPVWVINRNDDSVFDPSEMFVRSGLKSDAPSSSGRKTAGGTSGGRRLTLNSFRMLRNYDSWFAGASEFRIQIGCVDGFKASTQAELANYYPQITDFTFVVQRRYLDKDLGVGSILLTDFTNQMDKLAFLITEDDGGNRTSWKCSATVKIKSKSYGFDLEIPYNDKDDIVWRGQLSAAFFQEEDTVTGRFGDVMASFSLE